MHTEKLNGESETRVFDSQGKLMEAVAQAVSDPDIKTIRIKRLTNSQKRRQKRLQYEEVQNG